MTGKPAVEWAKWLGFGLMLLDHANAFLLHYRLGWAFLLGRLVFPLFAFALAEGLAGKGELRAQDVLRRLSMWACISQVPWSLFDNNYALNVMWVLAAGLAVWVSIMSNGVLWKRCVWAVVAVFVSVFAEFGIAGLGVVVAACWWRERPSHYSLGAVVFALLTLYVPNHSFFAIAALPVFWALGHLAALPRARHWFYPLYAGQFLVFGFLAWSVR